MFGTNGMFLSMMKMAIWFISHLIGMAIFLKLYTSMMQTETLLLKLQHLNIIPPQQSIPMMPMATSLLRPDLLIGTEMVLLTPLTPVNTTKTVG